MPNEQAYVQVAADGSGKKVANVSITEPQAVDSSGNVQADLTRYQQVVTVANARGDITDRWDEVLDELRAVNANLTLLLEVMETN